MPINIITKLKNKKYFQLKVLKTIVFSKGIVKLIPKKNKLEINDEKNLTAMAQKY